MANNAANQKDTSKKPQTVVATTTATTTSSASAATSTPTTQTTPDYTKHIQGFGSPEAYAYQINKAAQEGRALSDPAAAEAFKQAYPQLFQPGAQLVPPGVPSGYAPVRSTLESSGLNVSINPKTGGVVVKHPVTGATYEWKPKYVVEGKSYESPSVLETIKKQTLPSWEYTSQDIQAGFDKYQQEAKQQWDQYFTNQQNLINDFMGKMNDYMKQYSDAGINMLKQYQEQYSQSLDILRKMMEPDPEIPESVKLALDMLKKQTDENIKALDEEMANRGIYQSTFAMRERGKQLENLTTAQRQVMADWLDRQHDRMLDASIRYATAQAEFANNYANMYNQIIGRSAELGMGLTKDLYGMQSGLASQGFGFQSDLARQGFDLSSQLRQWASEQESVWKQAQAQAELERQKMEQEQARWQAQYSLDLAKLQEAQRHNVAMERRPVGGGGGGGFTAKQLWDISRTLGEEEAAQKLAKQIDDTARKYGVSRDTASLLISLEPLKGNETAARAEALAAMNSGQYPGVNKQDVEKILNQWFPKSQIGSSGGFWGKIVDGLRSIGKGITTYMPLPGTW